MKPFMKTTATTPTFQKSLSVFAYTMIMTAALHSFKSTATITCQAFISPASQFKVFQRTTATSTSTATFQSTLLKSRNRQFLKLYSSNVEEESTIPSSSPSSTASENNSEQIEPLVHRAEGLCAVHKPMDWTSQDVVSYIRGMLERDARERGVVLAKRRSRKSKKKIKVGHGGTLDPLAEGVLVLGIGSGTKILTNYLSGSKGYEATGKFGSETNTLDLEGNVTKTAEFDHITHEMVESSLDKFVGKIMQIPPIFSAIRKNGKRLYEQAREGKSAEDVVIDPREVEVFNLEYIPDDKEGLPSFGLSIQCGGGTYIRSLIRDIGYDLDSAATMTSLVRTQQGPFSLDDAMPREDWSADAIYAAVEKSNLKLTIEDENQDHTKAEST